MASENEELLHIRFLLFLLFACLNALLFWIFCLFTLSPTAMEEYPAF